MQEENTQASVAENEQPEPTDIRANVSHTQKWPFSRGRAFCTVAVVVLALMFSAGVSSLVVQAMQPAYVVFDMKGTIDTFRQQTAQSSLTKEALEALTKRFGAALDESLNGWQAKHGGIILVKGAVVAGAVDITPEIQADIARQMQGAP